MTLVQNLVYETPIQRLETPEDIVNLARSVKKDLWGRYTKVPAEKIIQAIKTGRLERGTEDGYVERIDLSAAKRLVDNYEARRKPKCPSCEDVRVSSPFSDEGYLYCILAGERESDAQTQSSSTVETYRNGGCPYSPSLPSFEDVLANVNFSK